MRVSYSKALTPHRPEPRICTNIEDNDAEDEPPIGELPRHMRHRGFIACASQALAAVVPNTTSIRS